MADDSATGFESYAGHKQRQSQILDKAQHTRWDVTHGRMGRAQITHENAAEQQAYGIAEPKLKRTEHQRDTADEQTTDKKGTKGHQIGGLTVNADETYPAGEALYTVLFATDLQYIAFLQHDVAIQWHLDL